MAHILVIDDEADIRTILERFFKKVGHTVDTAGDGKAAMRLLKLNRYDLVTTDVMMPEMDGLEVISAIRREFSDIRIIAMTGGAAYVDRTLMLSTAKAMRADKVIAKPLDIKVLKVAVDELLANGTEG